MKWFLNFLDFFVCFFKRNIIIYIIINKYIWPRPAQLSGPSSATEKGWADLGPTYIFLIFRVRTGLAQTFGLGQNWSNSRWGVNYFGRWMQNEFCKQRPQQGAQGRLMQGKDGGSPEVVRVCGRADGEDGIFVSGCNGGGSW